jgi:ribosomal protein L3 glutamine methyltransferase
VSLNALLARARKELFTVRDLLRFAVSRFNEAGLFFGHGTTNAHDEAAYLILHTLHLPLDRLEPYLDARLLPEEVEAVLRIIEQRVTTRKPAAYLTHEAWLGPYRFYVDERVIVPRSFIAELLQEGLAPWVDDAAAIETALDLCTGSGCLAILLAEAFPQAHVDAVDLSAEALEVAERNVADYHLQARVSLIRSDLFKALKGRRYDVIVSNPPYVDAQAMQSLPAEYRHEPRLALAGGEDGLDAVRRILDEAAGYLNPGGLLIVEVGHNRARLEAAFPHLPFTWLEAGGSDEFVFLLTREDLRPR